MNVAVFANLVQRVGAAQAIAAVQADAQEPTMGDAFEGTEQEWNQWLNKWRKMKAKTKGTQSLSTPTLTQAKLNLLF